ncbi:hypothetical protein MATL_G00117850 [Megalops atlanticus]|uniref:DNAX-activation protein 12 n=1 Tax=Megalops atlanticus TaxID=7932 RepID=A0A9D3PY40_MEGAT|nr:hypothetical protein MATL_G00117850 [Megalops atlanticus]
MTERGTSPCSMAKMNGPLLILILALVAVVSSVCENCYELDATLLTGIILGDLLVTGGVIILVYHWAQRRAGPSPAQPTGRTGNRAPTVPNRDYEPLNLTNRATETYAGLHRNG